MFLSKHQVSSFHLVSNSIYYIWQECDRVAPALIHCNHFNMFEHDDDAFIVRTLHDSASVVLQLSRSLALLLLIISFRLIRWLTIFFHFQLKRDKWEIWHASHSMRMHTLVCSAPQKHNLQPFVLMVTSFYIEFISLFFVFSISSHSAWWTHIQCIGWKMILAYMDIVHRFGYDRARPKYRLKELV